ncbi:MAG: hypothetical protein WCW13_06275 [archaeon]|jgi:hypothetical protein
MGLELFGKKEEKKEDSTESNEGEAKYQEACSLCGKGPTDKKWGGQFFHRKCFRRMRKGASKMI